MAQKYPDDLPPAFCWCLVRFSGMVKAIDPIGTAYKMEDYFTAFETTFEGLHNFMKGLAPLFPWLAGHSISFSIGMIILEIVLGVALIIGWRNRLTAWLLFILMVVFTFLTGFTYLTGFVPTDANFFDFAQWGPYVKEQMRVTDCGCFGDFIKLDRRSPSSGSGTSGSIGVVYCLGKKSMNSGQSVSGTSSSAFLQLLFCCYVFEIPIGIFQW